MFIVRVIAQVELDNLLCEFTVCFYNNLPNQAIFNVNKVFVHGKNAVFLINCA